MARITVTAALFLAGFLLPDNLLSQTPPDAPFTLAEPWMEPHSPEDFNDLLIASRADSWSSTGNWLPFDSTAYFYNAGGQESERISLSWMYPGWGNFRRYINQYDGKKVTLCLIQAWDFQWETCAQFVYKYDASNNLIAIILRTTYGPTLVNEYKITYGYDADNNKTLYLWQLWEGSQWKNYYQTLYEYDKDQNLTTEINQTWTANEWKYGNRQLYHYDANNNLILSISQILDGNGAWTSVSKTYYEYDARQNLAAVIKKNWSGVNKARDIFEYDDFNNQTLWLKQSWDGADWVTGSKWVYFYQIIDGVFDTEIQHVTVRVFPNPGNDQFTVDLSSGSLHNGWIQVFDANGQLVHTQPVPAGMEQISLQLPDLPQGAYLLQILEGGRPVVAERVVIGR